MNTTNTTIVITGGVCSSLGKGVIAASLASLFEEAGHSVSVMKLDPYLNVDPGTMSPDEHGEVYVTVDGAETDLDLGYYERFTRSPITRDNSVSMGQCLQTLLQGERNGEYLGRTIQVTPHLTGEICRRIRLFEQSDITIVELGGTVGDDESVPFLSAIRELKQTQDVHIFHVGLLPFVSAAQEFKTKPIQHSVKELQRSGLHPDAIFCRTEQEYVPPEVLKKISHFCNISPKHVFAVVDQPSIYCVPASIHDHMPVLALLVGKTYSLANTRWIDIDASVIHTHHTVHILIVGKYKNKDAYRSVFDALKHAGWEHKLDVRAHLVFDMDEYNGQIDGILIPGGFGERGVAEKRRAIAHALENDIPCFGICLGMQLLVLEALSSVNIQSTSAEFDLSAENPAVYLLPDQRSKTNTGASMRRGLHTCAVEPYTIAHKAYDVFDSFALKIRERHRHRYEINPYYEPALEKAGFVVSGRDLEAGHIEIVESQHMRWVLGCQFHPEFGSKPGDPHPFFESFVLESAGIDLNPGPPCSALDAAQYLRDKYHLTWAYIHRYLYWAQLQAIHSSGQPLFEDEIRAWAFSVCVVSVHEAHGSTFLPSDDYIVGAPVHLLVWHKKYLDKAFNTFRLKDTEVLHQSIMECPVYAAAREGLGPMERGDRVITVAALRECYSLVN